MPSIRKFFIPLLERIDDIGSAVYTLYHYATKLDPQVVNTFIGGLSDFSIGTKVRLSDDQIGEIVFIDAKQPSQPLIRIENSGEIVALKNKPALFIDEVLLN